MVTLGTGQTKIAVQAVIQSRSHARRNIQGGISAEVSGTVEIRKQDWFLAGGTLANPVSATFIGLLVTYQDGAQGRVTSAEDYGGPIITLQVGAVLQGDKGPQGGLW